MAMVAFTNPGDFMPNRASKVSEFQDARHFAGSEAGSDACFEDIVGKSRALQRVLEQIVIVAPTDSNSLVLLHGDTGTGKGADCARHSQPQPPPT